MRKVFNFILGIFIVLSATAFIAGKPFGEVQGHVYKIGILALFIISLYMKPLRWKSNNWINSMFALTLAANLIQPMQAKLVAIEGLVHILLGITFLYILIQHLDNPKIILNSIAVVVSINAFMVLCQSLKIDPICLNDGGQPNTHLVGLFGFKYSFGAYMSMAAPLLLFMRKFISGVVAAVLTICSLSWAAIGVMIFAIIFGLWFTSKKIAIIMLVLCIVATAALYFGYLKPREMVYGIVKASDGTFALDANGRRVEGMTYHPASLPYKIKTRFLLEAKLLPVLFSRPATGYGLGSFKYIGPKINTFPYGTMTDAWNDYIERGIECGIGIIALFLCLFWSAFKRFLKSDKSPILIGSAAALITIPIGMGLHDYFNHFNLMVIIIAIMAIFEINIKEDISEDSICGK